MNDALNDIKPPVDLPMDYTWIWWAIGIVVLLIIGWFIYKKLTTNKLIVTKPLIVQKPWEKALASLQGLEVKQYPKQGLYREFFDGVSDIVRVYVEEQFNIRAPEMTTEEFLISLQSTTVLSDKQQHILKTMMASADLVKFAKHEPTLNDCEQFYRTAVQLVEESRGV